MGGDGLARNFVIPPRRRCASGCVLSLQKKRSRAQLRVWATHAFGSHGARGSDGPGALRDAGGGGSGDPAHVGDV